MCSKSSSSWDITLLLRGREDLCLYTEELYSESPPRKSISLANNKQLEADIDVLCSHSSDPDVWDPVGKTPKEFAAWCAEYKRGNRRKMAKHHSSDIAGIYRERTETCAASVFFNGASLH
jgi:hypothetical protein